MDWAYGVMPEEWDRRITMKMSGKKNYATMAILTAVLSTTAAWGQVRQVQMNNPLDANPQVGAGGANRPVPGYVPVNGNEVMTGNVGGLGAWHGQVGRPGNQSGLGVFSP